MNSNVNALWLNGTTLYTGGSFTTVNGGANAKNYLAAYNATTGALGKTGVRMQTVQYWQSLLHQTVCISEVISLHLTARPATGLWR